jgi:hypothetical protein
VKRDFSLLDTAERQRIRARLLASRGSAGEDECWHWKGAINDAGYGITKVLGRKGWLERVHRLALVVFLDADLGADLVCHKCDVRDCFNPSHLFLGTHQENTDDMHGKGRWVRPRVRRGVECGRAILKEHDVRSIIADSLAGVSRAELGRRFGVSISTISKLVLGQNWSHITANCGVAKGTRGGRGDNH